MLARTKPGKGLIALGVYRSIRSTYANALYVMYSDSVQTNALYADSIQTNALTPGSGIRFYTDECMLCHVFRFSIKECTLCHVFRFNIKECTLRHVFPFNIDEYTLRHVFLSNIQECTDFTPCTPILYI